MKQVICDHCGKVLREENKIDYFFEGNVYKGKKLQHSEVEECWADYIVRPISATQYNVDTIKQLCWNCLKELQKIINDYCGYVEGGDENASH